MPDPTENIPTDAPTGQGDGRFDLGALGFGVPWTAWIGTVVELTNEMDRIVEGEEMTVAMVADIHPVTTVWAVAIQDVEFPESEIGILWPVMRHGVDLRAVR